MDPPLHGLFTGGMEYPTLISSLSFCFFPKGFRTAEILVTHEFIHQYFMQMVATHEVEEPWMDEGFTSYYESRIMDKYYGEHSSMIDWLGVKIGNKEFNRAEYLSSPNPEIAPASTISWQYKHGGYGTIAYNKTAMWMNTLDGLVGREVMDEIMKTYFERWKFKHPCGQDFIDVVNEIVAKRKGTGLGENMNWFFDQVLYGTEECDFSIASISNERELEAAGFIGENEDCIRLDENKIKPLYTSSVTVHRLGEMKLPVEIKVDFEDGSSKLEYWNGRDRAISFTYHSANRIINAEVDPERKIDLDSNFLNNSKTIKPNKSVQRKFFTKFLLGAQEILQTLNALV